jgi:hypothetical protein
MMQNLKPILFIPLFTVILSDDAWSAVAINVDSTYVGILEGSPNSSLSILDYSKCTSLGDSRQALLKFNIVGNGANQVPMGSTVTSATLRLRSVTTGDGNMYRAGVPWNSSSTWNSLGGDVPPADSTTIGIGNTTLEFTVTSHVALWVAGTHANEGWVLK